MRMPKFIRVSTLFFAPLLACVPASAAPVPEPERRPNVVFFLADDLGYMDIGAYNPQTFYETPRIDRLAAEGMRFTAGYAACAVCSPTRSSIMTGKYPPRTGITDYIPGGRTGKLLPAPINNQLALEEVTVAEAFREAGYATFFAGKWHLGDGPYGPKAQGFGPDLDGRTYSYYPAGAKPDPKNDPKDSDRIAEAAAAFISDHKDKPFFAYLPFHAVHIPVGARPDLVERFRKKAETAPPDAWGREGASQVRLVQNRADYAAMLAQMDAAVGRVLDALEQAGVADRTIVVFMSDNGGLATAEGHPTSNKPLRAGKGWPYEGGVRVPWIIRAPGVAKEGSVCEAPVISNDFYPTLLALAGLPQRPEQHLDGVNLEPLLRGGSIAERPLFWHYPHYGNQGGRPVGTIQKGGMKLIEWYEDGRTELYDLRADRNETHDLAPERPDEVAALRSELHAWRQDVGAIMPTPAPAPAPGDAQGRQP